MDEELDTVGGDDNTVWMSACIECVRLKCARNLFLARVDRMLSSLDVTQHGQQGTYRQRDTVEYDIWHEARSTFRVNHSVLGQLQ